MEAFLRRVLPAGGSYVVDAIKGSSGARELRGLPDIPSVAKAAQRLSLGAANVYFAVGTYGADRKEPLAKRCLYLDLDPKTLGTKDMAAKELGIFCRTTGFPAPSIWVDSGHGLHVYWTFDRDLEIPAWRILAEKLKAKCIELDFKADHGVTADAARILRMPGTMNVKEQPPVPCRVLKDTGLDYDPGSLLRVLMPVAPSGALAKLAAMVGANDLSAGPALENYPQVPYYATEIAEKCAVFKDALATGGRDHSEPLWRHLLGLLTFTDDGEKLIHEISKGHPDYKAEQTEAKYAQVLKLKTEGKLKPILCTTFETYKGAACAGCAYKGRIKTPMVLGKIESTAYLPLYYRMADYSVQKLTKKGEPGEPEIWSDVFPYRISDVTVHDHGDLSAKQVTLTFSSKRDTRKVDIESTLLAMQGDALPLMFSHAGLWVTGPQIAEFKTFMTTWLRRMADTKAATRVEMTGLGWGKRNGKDAFAAGGRVYTEDGEEFDFYHADPTMVRNYLPKGDPAVWEQAANAIAKDSRQAAVAALLTSFAAPLVNFAGVKGLTFSLYSAASGTGKSSILRTAQSVWGHPTRGMAMIDDTQLSVINKLGFLNTIPAYWDEMRSGDTLINFVKMIFTLGQGREKSRLTSTIRQQAAGTWDTLITIASNERLVDHVDRYIKNTDAGRLRLFEVTLPALRSLNPTLSKTFSDLEKNYGHAGIRYAKYLATHRSEAEKLVHDFQAFVLTKVQAGSTERFWVAFVAAIMAAAALVEKAGILKVDIPKLTQWLLSEFIAQQGGVASNYKAPVDAATASIFSFIDAHRNHMVLVESFSATTGMSKYGNILTPPAQMPRDEILILKAVNDNLIRFKKDAWKDWVVKELGHSPTTLEAELQRLGVKQVRASLGAGIQAASNARIMCVEIDLKSSNFGGLLDD